MPVTPFHFGPGAALHAIAPRHVSFLAFCATNVLIDLESLHNLRRAHYPVHEFFHTYVGATLAGLGAVLLFVVLRALARGIPLPNTFSWQGLTILQVALGAAAGAYSHVFFDSIMHADMTPLAPFSDRNVLLGVLSLDTLHWLCILSGLLAGLLIALRKFTPLFEK